MLKHRGLNTCANISWNTILHKYMHKNQNLQKHAEIYVYICVCARKNCTHLCMVGWLVGWLVGWFNGISVFVDYLKPYLIF